MADAIGGSVNMKASHTKARGRKTRVRPACIGRGWTPLLDAPESKPAATRRTKR